MKKALLLIGTMLVMGAGCSQETANVVPPAGTDSQVNSASSSPAEQTPQTPEVAVGDLKDLPAVDPTLASNMDASAWSKATTRTGVTLTVPNKGSYAPMWTYTILANDDSHLKGDCFVTDGVIYKRTTFVRQNTCLTTTELAAGPGTRTDYLVFHDTLADAAGKQVTRTHLFTFTKVYPAGFSMDGYTATLEKIVGLFE